MRLNEIFEQAKNKLSHAELNLYLAFCSFADNETGECFPRLKTVAERANLHDSNASTYAKKLETLKFIKKVKNGYLCLVGYNQSYNNNNFSTSNYKSPSYNNNNFSTSDNNQSYNNNNSFNNNYSLTEKEEGTSPALLAYREVYPKINLDDYQAKLLLRAEIVETDFREAVRYWAGNGYKPKNIVGLLDCYDRGTYRTKPPTPKPKDDSGLYKTIDQIRAERANIIITIPKHLNGVNQRG